VDVLAQILPRVMGRMAVRMAIDILMLSRAQMLEPA
jgi:hypothetical protein